MLESHFDEVEYDYQGQQGLFKVSHKKYGNCIVDSVELRVVQCEH